MTPTNRRRHRARAALVLTGVVLLAAACLPSPIHPDNRPTTIPRAQNGYIGDDSLRSAGPNCLVWREAAASLGSMIAAARKAGVELQTEECYRDYAGQVEVRNRWCFVGMCQMAAVPGRSNHGWAKAADFEDQGGELTFDSAGYAWMVANASKYGWNHPGSLGPDSSAPEAWHWEWVGDGGQMFPGQVYGIGNAAFLPPDGTPVGSLDIVTGSTSGSPSIRVAGWAIDPNSESGLQVHIYVDNQLAATPWAKLPRSDLASMYTAWGGQHGFDATIDTTKGSHQVCVWATNLIGRGDNIQLGCRTVTIA